MKLMTKIRQKLSVIRLTLVATARDALQCDKSAIAVPVFSRRRQGGRGNRAVTILEPGWTPRPLREH